MTYGNRSGAFALVATLLGSTAAMADITAEEVWQGWTSYYADMGQSLSVGTKTMQGDTLVISDAMMTATVPDGTFNMTIAEIRLREMGDGRVEVTMSEEIPVRMLSQPSTGETVDMGMKMTQSGLITIVSGSTVDSTYDFSATKLALSVDGMKVDDETVPMKLDVSMGGTGGSYRMTSNDLRQITSDFRADSLDFSVSAQDPEGAGSFSSTGGFTGLTGTSVATMPSGLDMSNMNAVLQAGMEVTGSFAYGGGGYSMDFADGQDTVAIKANGGGGGINLAMSKAGLSYGIVGGASQVTIQSSSFPVPIDMSLTSSAFNLAVPISKSDADQPFSLLMKIVDLKVSDGLWNMIDPGMQLPRDPATLIVDLKGTAKLLLDIMDPANAEKMNSQPPGELTSVDVNEVALSIAGADLTGKGAVIINNQGLMPQPVGSVDMQLIGGNGLIDKLVGMGLVPEDQAKGVRLMMGLFAVKTGDDTLTSKIEFKEDGGVYANGQCIQ
ncbi:MAG: DUF2125 domain-containing protein [Albidovulum sp.]